MVDKNPPKRFSADGLRAISKETAQKKRVQTTINKHRSSLWGQLIGCASEGLFSTELSNLSDQDISFLREVGLYVSEKFKRVKERTLIENQLEKLKADYKTLLKPGAKSPSKLDTPDEQMEAISKIASKNQGLAYIAGLEEWFGDNFSFFYIETMEEALNFLEQIESKYTVSVDTDKRTFLKKLIPHAKKLIALMKDESETESALEIKSSALADHYQALEESDDYLHDADVRSIHEVDWGSCDNWKPFGGFNSYDLFWLSSRDGQNFLSEIEGKIVNAAQKGYSKIVFNVEDAQTFRHMNDIKRFDPYRYKTDGINLTHLGPLPSLFATIIELGGSKPEVKLNNDETYTVTVKW